MTRERIADADAREQALDPARSFIVQAPAGSGKTELLTQRTLALLALADEPEEVVAITFTRKAAAEMRARVFGRIREALGAAPDDAHARQTWMLAGKALARSRDRGWKLDQSPQRLRITTIDALAASIAQQSPLLSELGGGVVVEDDPQELYRQAARDTLALLEEPALGAPVARALAHYDNRVQALEGELAQLLPRRDQWMDLAVRDAPEHRREAMEAVLRDCAQATLHELEALLPAALAVEWHMLACYAADNLTREKPDHVLVQCLDAGAPAYGAECLARWQALSTLVLTKDDWRAALDKRIGFPAGDSPAEKRTARQFKDRAKTLIDGLRQIPGSAALLGRIRALPPIHYTDTQWEILVALLDTLKLAAGQLQVLFAQGGTVDFVEIGQRAVRALGEEDAPTDLALRLDYRVRHLLVDEFQDTSRLQLELLRALTAGWQDGDGRTLFVVGDPAQSIYRFRDAEVGYFLGARRNGLCGISLTPLELTCNFRSSSRLVEWFNETFPAVLAPTEDVVHGAVSYAPAIATRDARLQDCVQVHASIGADWKAEAQAVVATLVQLREAEPQASVAILVRSRNHLVALAPALRRAGLRYQAVEIEELATRPVIEDLRALTRALLHPADRVAWLALLRAPWCGIPLGDLQVLAHGSRAGDPLAAALRDSARVAALSAESRERLRATLEVLHGARLALGRLRLRDLVERAWLALGGPACCAGAVDLADAARFFAVLDRVGRGGDLPSLATLDRALAVLRAAPDPEGGLLQVMTVHKSKGLEFDHVLLPGLHRSPQRGGRAPLAWTTLPGSEGPQFLVAPIGATGAEDDRAYEFVRDVDQDKRAWEDGRLLYVACTRARRGLHLFADCKDDGSAPEPPAAGSLLHKLWVRLAPEFTRAYATRAMPADELEAVAARRAPPLRRFVTGWRPQAMSVSAIAMPASDSRIAFEWAGGIARAVGIVVHTWLQHIAESNVDDWTSDHVGRLAPAIARALAAEGLTGAELANGRDRVVQALQNTLADERGRWLLAVRDEARNELAIGAAESGFVRDFRIDRTFVDDGTRWIVDYKTSAHEGGRAEEFLDQEVERYRPQLETYARMLAQMESRPIRLGLYFPLLKAWRCWAVADSPRVLTKAAQLQLPI